MGWQDETEEGEEEEEQCEVRVRWKGKMMMGSGSAGRWVWITRAVCVMVCVGGVLSLLPSRGAFRAVIVGGGAKSMVDALGPSRAIMSADETGCGEGVSAVVVVQMMREKRKTRKNESGMLN